MKGGGGETRERERERRREEERYAYVVYTDQIGSKYNYEDTHTKKEYKEGTNMNVVMGVKEG